VLQRVAWDQGDATRGGVIFRERACQTCHAAANTIGPDLAGVTGRFSKEDLFHSIVFPNRDIAPPYRPAVFVMRDGQTHTGMVAFNSADGVILQTGPATTVRLDEKDIVSQREGDQSLMPAGLLDGLQPGDLADLYAYLKELQPGAMR
jgi:putative heme-binding domain-containing protein